MDLQNPAGSLEINELEERIMAQRRKSSTKYETFGNVAYEAATGETVLDAPRDGAVSEPLPRLRPREEAQTEARVRTRRAGVVSPFAVIGFLCVAVLAVVLLVNCTQLAVYTDEMTTLRTELTDLQEEEADLLVQYELAYDLKSIKDDMLASGTMVEPDESQKVTLDLSEPDSIVVYDASEPESTGFWAQIGHFFSNLFG